jgi:hypothetical protein
MLKELIKIANTLDKRGLTKEADYLDSVIRKFASACGVSNLPYQLVIHFDRGNSSIDPAIWNPAQQDMARCLIEAGMSGDQKFIKIKAGTSGTGNAATNNTVMQARIREALGYLANLGAQGPLPLGHGHTGTGTGPINAESLWNKSDVATSFDIIEPGDVVGYVNAPDDPDDSFYRTYQYVEISIDEPEGRPNLTRLANDFVSVTTEKLNPNYIKDQTGGGHNWMLNTAVYDIIRQLRNLDDFNEFNAQICVMEAQSFYEIACSPMLGNVPTTFTTPTVPLPWWMGGGTIGGGTHPVPIIGGAPIGPEEIGEESYDINALLEALGAPAIDCSSIPKC